MTTHPDDLDPHRLHVAVPDDLRGLHNYLVRQAAATHTYDEGRVLTTAAHRVWNLWHDWQDGMRAATARAAMREAANQTVQALRKALESSNELDADHWLEVAASWSRELSMVSTPTADGE